jgi:hypothetical protein
MPTVGSRTNYLRSKAAIIAMALLVSSCSSRQPDAALRKEQQTIVSWIETTRTIADAWKNYRVPSAYTSRTFKTAQQTLEQESRSIPALPISPDAKGRLVTTIELVHNSLGQAVAGIDKGERPAMDPVIDQLETAKQTLEESAGGPSQ